MSNFIKILKITSLLVIFFSLFSIFIYALPPACPIKSAGCHKINTDTITTFPFGELLPSEFDYYLHEYYKCVPTEKKCDCRGNPTDVVEQTNPDDSSGACNCIAGTAWNTKGKCCGDDEEDDCAKIVSGVLCSIDPNLQSASWIASSTNIGDIRYVGCSQIEYLSDGSTWIKCEDTFEDSSKRKIVGTNEYMCIDSGRESIVECCGDDPCKSIVNGKRLSTGQTIVLEPHITLSCTSPQISAACCSEAGGAWDETNVASGSPCYLCGVADGIPKELCFQQNKLDPDICTSTNYCNHDNYKDYCARHNMPCQGSSDPDPNLKLYWKFDELNGTTAFDSSGNNNEGAIFNATRTPGSVGGALYFPNLIRYDVCQDIPDDGTECTTYVAYDYVRKNLISNFPTNEITIIFWVKTQDSIGAIVSYRAKGGNDFVILNNKNIIKIRRDITKTDYSSYVDTKIVINDNQWHFVAVTWNSANGETKLYKDGSLAYTNPAKKPLGKGKPLKQDGSFVIGQRQFSLDGYSSSQDFNGALDEIRIYNKVLTQDEIQALYSNNINPNPQPNPQPQPQPPQIPVCGNKICEQNENEDNCTADCRNKTYYCRQDKRFVTDLDTPESQATCEKAGFKWTGTKCCSEADDNIGVKKEYYNDAEGNGGCWKSKLVISIDFVNDTNDSVINYNGEFHGCAIDKTNYNANNDNLSNILDTHTGAALITNHEYCFNDPENNYYCSYTEKWLPTDGADKTHLSSAPISNPQQAKECCAQNECWNGSSCIVNQGDKPSDKPFNGYRCIDGNWTTAKLVCTPDDSICGYCPNSTQCLLNPQATNEKEQCVESGNYTGDDYCEDGNWSSRTKLFALKLLKLKSGDFILFCDNKENTLNNLQYLSESGEIVANVLTNLQTNNFCVLKSQGKVIAATSINKDIEDASKNSLNIFGVVDCDDALIDDGQYHSCDATNKVWFNKRLKSFIYSKTAIAIPPEQNQLSSFEEFIGNPIKSIIVAIKRLITNPPWDESYYLKGIKKFNRLYMVQQGDKLIRGSIEGQLKLPYFKNAVIQYTGFDTDICNFIDNFGKDKKDASGIVCKKEGNNYYVLAQGSQLTNLNPESIWPDLTSKLRLK